MKFYSQIDTLKIPIKSPVMENATSAPASPVEGQMWWDSNNNLMFLYDGTDWQRLWDEGPHDYFAGGSIDMNNFGIFNLPDPSMQSSAATKAYVDGVAQGLDAKQSVKCATTGNVNIASSVPATIDGVSTLAGDRILVKSQSAPAENGIYFVTIPGGFWQRTEDMDAWTDVPGAFTFVEQGTTNADTGWVCTANTGGTLNTTAITWSQFSSAGSYTAGNGLALTGSDFSVNVDNSSIEINADTLRVKAAGITNAMLAGSIDLTTKVTGSLPVANGGTGGTTAATARANLTAVGWSTTTNPALTANVWSSNISHFLNTGSPVVTIRESGTTEGAMIDWKVADANNIQIRAAIAVSAGALQIVTHG